MAGFREFLTGEVLTAANVNNFLMKQSVMVFADAAARTAALGAEVTEGMLTFNKDTGQLEVFDGAAFVAARAAGIGSNVVSATKNDAFSTGSNNLVDVTGLTVTITPSSATAKVLIIADVTIASSASPNMAAWLVTDGSNNPIIAVASGPQFDGATDDAFANSLNRQSKHYLASPDVATPVTFKVRAAMVSGGGATTFINRSPNNVQFAVSTITAIEVAA